MEKDSSCTGAQAVARSRHSKATDVPVPLCPRDVLPGFSATARRLPTEHPTLFRWSAPLFVTVSGGGGGLTFGHTTTSSFTVCMTPALRTQLEGKGKAPFGGLDASLIVGPRLIESAEFGTASYATVGARVEGGLLFNLSYTAGTIALDKAKNARLYGAEVSAADVLEGRVPEPAELQPLYGDLAGIVHSVERPSAPSLVRSSLDRATLGGCES